jgi:hypothetical protein
MVKVAVADHIGATSPTAVNQVHTRSPRGPSDPAFRPPDGKLAAKAAVAVLLPPHSAVRLQPPLSVPANMAAPAGKCRAPGNSQPAIGITYSKKCLQCELRDRRFLLLSSGLDFHDRLLHCLIHGAANLMVGLCHAFRVEVPADRAEHAVTVGMVEIGRDDIGGI